MQWLGSEHPAGITPLAPPDDIMGGCHAGLMALLDLPARVTALELVTADQHETFDVLHADIVHVEQRVNGLGAHIERARLTAVGGARWHNPPIPHVWNID